MSARAYSSWRTLMAHPEGFWVGLTPSEILLAQQGEADLICLLRRKYGLNDSEVKQQISEYLGRAIALLSH